MNYYKLIGDEDLIKRLKKLEKEAQRRKIVRKAMRKASAAVKKKAQELAPKKTGLLRKAMKNKVIKTMSGKVYVDPKVKEESFVDENGKQHFLQPSKYAHLVEFGTKHSPPHPFMRRALTQTHDSAVEIIRVEVKKELDKLC